MAGRGAKPGERRGGRAKGTPNKSTKDIKAIAQPYGPEAVETLVSIMRDVAQPPAARVAASKEVLDRGFGKSVQKNDLTSSDGTMTPKGLGDFYASLEGHPSATNT